MAKDQRRPAEASATTRSISPPAPLSTPTGVSSSMMAVTTDCRPSGTEPGRRPTVRADPRTQTGRSSGDKRDAKRRLPVDQFGLHRGEFVISEPPGFMELHELG